MPNITRRTLLAGSALSAAAPFAPAVGAALPAGVETPGIYRYRIGTFQLTALYDGIWYRRSPTNSSITPQRCAWTITFSR